MAPNTPGTGERRHDDTGSELYRILFIHELNGHLSSRVCEQRLLHGAGELHDVHGDRIRRERLTFFCLHALHLTIPSHQLPILVTSRMRTAYNHIDDDRLVVTRPAAMSELSAIRALRTGDSSDFFRNVTASAGSDIGGSLQLRNGVDDMLRKGWRRTNAGFGDVKRRIWAENDRFVERLVRDL